MNVEAVQQPGPVPTVHDQLFSHRREQTAGSPNSHLLVGVVLGIDDEHAGRRNRYVVDVATSCCGTSTPVVKEQCLPAGELLESRGNSPFSYGTNRRLSYSLSSEAVSVKAVAAAGAYGFRNPDNHQRRVRLHCTAHHAVHQQMSSGSPTEIEEPACRTVAWPR